MSQQWRDGWSAGGEALPRAVSVQARRTPEAVAVASPGYRLTYAQLEQRSSRVSRWLRLRGLGSESRVGVYIGRPIELVVALLGVLRSGCAYAPIDLSYPDERIRFMVEDSGAEAVITAGDRTVGPFIPSRTEVLRLVKDEPELEWLPGYLVEPRLSPENLAYATYTSGSTGRPKGVMVTHGGLRNYLFWAARAFLMTGRHGSVVHSSVGFDLTVTSLYLPLLSGHDFTLLPEGPEPLERLADALTGGFDCSIVGLTPSHLTVLRDEVWARKAEGRTTAVSARAFVVGGEALTPGLAEAWRALAPNTGLYNHYGPSETVVGRMAGEAIGDLEGSSTVPIGLPIDSTSVHIMDAAMRPVSSDVIGELFIGGTGLARGYLGRPGLTAERFVPETANGEGARLYRTGDLVRRLLSGALEFVGRADDQVKVRGHCVKLGEIEAVLQDHPDVSAAAAAVRDRGDGTELVAYVVWCSGAGDPVRLQSALRLTLPDFHDALNGRRSRPVAGVGEREAGPCKAARAAGAVLDHLVRFRDRGRERCSKGVATCFRGRADRRARRLFELGGDSILAIRATAELRRAGYPATSGMVLAGVRAIVRTTLLRSVVLTGICAEMAFQALQAVLPVLVINQYDADAKLTGLLLNAWGGGAAAGCVVAAVAVLRVPARQLVKWSALAQCLPLWLLPFPVDFPLAMTALVLPGLANGLAVAPEATLLTIGVSRLGARPHDGRLHHGPHSCRAAGRAAGGVGFAALGATPVLAAITGLSTAGAVGLFIACQTGAGAVTQHRTPPRRRGGGRVSTNTTLRDTVAVHVALGHVRPGGEPVLDGRGWAHGHHGELLQGVFEVGGSLHRGLATLPCPMFTTRARVRLSALEPELTVTPAWKTKALQAVRCTLHALGSPALGGHLVLDSNVDVGRGFGSSTSDVTAAIRAVLAALGRRMTPEEVARIAVSAEVAADPLMFDHMILFAHREGIPLEDFRVGMCGVEVLGIALGRSEVDTLALPPARYDAWEIECFRALRGLLRHGIVRRDVRAVGRVATASARINQRFLPDSRFTDLMAVATESRAVGVQVAHSGNIAGLLFDPRDPDTGHAIALAGRRLAQRGLGETWRYSIREDDDGLAFTAS